VLQNMVVSFFTQHLPVSACFAWIVLWVCLFFLISYRLLS
jgi:hypothetical protein